MKNLQLNEMEKLNGGNVAWSCAGGAAVAAIGVAATILSGGLFGFAAVLGMSYAMASCAIAAGEMSR